MPTDTPHTVTFRIESSGCWCPLDQPCHADVLLEIANGGTVRDG